MATKKAKKRTVRADDVKGWTPSLFGYEYPITGNEFGDRRVECLPDHWEWRKRHVGEWFLDIEIVARDGFMIELSAEGTLKECVESIHAQALRLSKRFDQLISKIRSHAETRK